MAAKEEAARRAGHDPDSAVTAYISHLVPSNQARDVNPDAWKADYVAALREGVESRITTIEMKNGIYMASQRWLVGSASYNEGLEMLRARLMAR